NTRSLIAILSSGIVGGSTFDVQANGEDEIEAIVAVSELVNRLSSEH
ncbi:MAG: HPr family phosphocarrier protein, partial [Alkaliphilus sp.]